MVWLYIHSIFKRLQSLVELESGSGSVFLFILKKSEM